MRDTRDDVYRLKNSNDSCSDYYHVYNQVIRENSVSGPEYIELDDADIVNFKTASEAVDYYSADFNNDNNMDFLLQNLGSSDVNSATQTAFSSCGNTYHQCCNHLHLEETAAHFAEAIEYDQD